MTDSTAEFFGALGRSGPEPLLEKAHGTIRFDLVQGGSTEAWFLTLDGGHVSVTRKKAARGLRDPRRASDLRRDRERRVNAMAAVLRGAVTVEGDPELLVLFQRLFPGPRAGSPGR